MKKFEVAIILVSGISAQCTTDSSLFSLTCTGVSIKIDVDESCLNSGQSKYSLSADFDTSIYVSRTSGKRHTETEYRDVSETSSNS